MNLLTPIEWCMEQLLTAYYAFTGSHGVSVILMSITINVLAIPIYRWAARMRKTEQAIQKKMQAEIDKIDAVYTGRERHYYVRTIHRQFDRSLVSTLKVAAGPLIQLPLLIAAYQLLLDYAPHMNHPFGPMPSLSQPDGLIEGINALPILMTLANLATIELQRHRDPSINIRPLVLTAGMFLLLLYGLASNLLLYWTTSNVFGLLREVWSQRRRLVQRPPATVRLPTQLYFGAAFGLFVATSLVHSNIAMVAGVESFSTIVALCVVPCILIFWLVWLTLRAFSKESLAPAVAFGIATVLAFNKSLVEGEIFEAGFTLRNAMLGAFIAMAIVFFLQKAISNFRAVATVLCVVAVLFSLNTWRTIGTYNDKRVSLLAPELRNAELKHKPNIYHVLPDSFVSFSTAEKLGIDVSDLRSYLEDKGFTIYPDYHASYHFTSVSVSSMLDMTHHYYNDAVGRAEIKGSRPVVAGKNNLNYLLKREGYTNTVVHSTGYFFAGHPCDWDYCYPNPTLPLVIERAFATEKIRSWFGDSFDEFNEEIERALDRAIETQPSYTTLHHHKLPGHSMKYRTCDSKYELKAYKKRVAAARLWIENLIDKITARDPSAIIVLASDHGGYVTSNCWKLSRMPANRLEIEDRISALAAIRWPDDPRAEPYKPLVQTSVSLYPILISYLADDPSLLQYRALDQSYVQIDGEVYRVVDDGQPLWPVVRFEGIDNVRKTRRPDEGTLAHGTAATQP